MNREQRRAKQHPRLSHTPPEARVTTNIGHNGSRVVLQFSQPIRNMLMTAQEADEHIAAVLGAKAMLIERLATADASKAPD